MATVQTLDKIRESLEKVYPSVFVVKLDSDNEGCSRVSYSYSDLLTSNVKLQVFRNQDKLHVS